MKNYEYWKNFIQTGKIDDYLNYIACTKEDISDEGIQIRDKDEEGGIHAGINYRDGNGPVGYADWGLR